MIHDRPTGSEARWRAHNLLASLSGRVRSGPAVGLASYPGSFWRCKIDLQDEMEADIAQRDPGAEWQIEADFGTSRGLVNMIERDGRFEIRVRLDAVGREPVTLTLTPDQAGWLGEALPAALAMLRSWLEQRDWEVSFQDPFAAFDGLDQDGDPAESPSPIPAGPGQGTSEATPPSDRSPSMSAEPGSGDRSPNRTTGAPATASGERRATDGQPLDQRAVDARAPIPKRRGQPWGAQEEARLVKAYRAGQGVDQLAVLLDRSPRAIRKRLEKLELVSED